MSSKPLFPQFSDTESFAWRFDLCSEAAAICTKGHEGQGRQGRQGKGREARGGRGQDGRCGFQEQRKPKSNLDVVRGNVSAGNREDGEERDVSGWRMWARERRERGGEGGGEMKEMLMEDRTGKGEERGEEIGRAHV